MNEFLNHELSKRHFDRSHLTSRLRAVHLPELRARVSNRNRRIVALYAGALVLVVGLVIGLSSPSLANIGSDDAHPEGSAAATGSPSPSAPSKPCELKGKWKLSGFKGFVGSTDDSIQAKVSGIEGKASLEFKGDDKYVIKYEDLALNATVQSPDGNLDLSMAMNGETDGTYKLVDSKLTLKVDKTTQHGEVTEKVQGQTLGPIPVDPSDNDSDEMTLPSGDYTVTCRGDELSIAVPDDESPGTIDFKKSDD